MKKLMFLLTLTGCATTATPRQMRAWCGIKSVQAWTDTTVAFRERVVSDGKAQGITVRYSDPTHFTCSIPQVRR